jgi:hypothetical protein
MLDTCDIHIVRFVDSWSSVGAVCFANSTNIYIMARWANSLLHSIQNLHRQRCAHGLGGSRAQYPVSRAKPYVVVYSRVYSWVPPTCEKEVRSIFCFIAYSVPCTDRASSVPSSAFNSLTDSLFHFYTCRSYRVCGTACGGIKQAHPSVHHCISDMTDCFDILDIWIVIRELKVGTPPAKTESTMYCSYTSGLTWPSTIIIASVMFGNLICWHDISWSTPMSIHWTLPPSLVLMISFWSRITFNIPFSILRRLDWLLFS